MSLTGGDSLLFIDKGKPLRAARLCYTLRKTAERAGCDRAPEDPPLRFHDLRHSAASIMIAAGADIAFVARQLGHASPAITLSTYAHLLDEASNIDRVSRYVTGTFITLEARRTDQVQSTLRWSTRRRGEPLPGRS